MEYQVDLDTFRGPLDLLLYLVKREEVDVFDIPLARIAAQYVQYLELLELIDVERAGDFLVMASTLMEIKSRLLLPRTEEQAGEEEDPRLELVRQLIAYKKFKDAAAVLEDRAERQAMHHARNTPPPARNHLAAPMEPTDDVELWDLVSAFGRLMQETLATQPNEIVVDETPIQVHMDTILQQLEGKERLAFEELFRPPRTRSRLVGLFMGMLELIKAKRIAAEQEAPFSQIWIVPLPAALEPPQDAVPPQAA